MQWYFRICKNLLTFIKHTALEYSLNNTQNGCSRNSNLSDVPGFSCHTKRPTEVRQWTWVASSKSVHIHVHTYKQIGVCNVSTYVYKGRICKGTEFTSKKHFIKQKFPKMFIFQLEIYCVKHVRFLSLLSNTRIYLHIYSLITPFSCSFTTLYVARAANTHYFDAS